MRLLVSVRDAVEAAAAVAGGAAIVDAKEPARGALGAVDVPVFAGIAAAVASAPVTAALGDAGDEADVQRLSAAFAAHGARLVKLGFAGVPTHLDVVRLLNAARRGCTTGLTGGERREACGVVAVAYADAAAAGALSPWGVLAAAMSAGASGVLVDTFAKEGGGLFDAMSPDEVTRWVEVAREASLLTAIAGRLTSADLSRARDTGADIVGVRGAACDGDRRAAISASRVAGLARLLGADSSPQRSALQGDAFQGADLPISRVIAFTR